MKKSKFLLLGSVASLASIPFVVAKCGETKEEKKPEARQNQSLSENIENQIPGEKKMRETVQLAENIKQQRKNLKPLNQKTMVTRRFVNTKRQVELKIKRWFKHMKT